MPMQRLLTQSPSFDPKAVSILLETYDGVVAELRLQTPEEKERAAKLIVRLAEGQPDLDVAKLREGVTAILAEVPQ
jgi:hypothetical protein